MRNNDLIRLSSAEDIVKYMLDVSNEHCEDECVTVILRRDEAVECFTLLVEEYFFDVLLAIINPDYEDLFYAVNIGCGDVSIEPIYSDDGKYLDCCANYMLIEEDVPSRWLINQSCDNYDVLVLNDEHEDECICDDCACLEEYSISLEELIEILDADGGLAKILKVFGDLV